MTTIDITTNGRGKHSKSNGMQLNGNELSGDTFNARGYIKEYLDGKWNAEKKVWTVNVEKTMALLNTPGAHIAIKD